MMQWMGKMIIIFGIVLVVVGVILYFGSRIGIGRLPGDIVVRRGNFTLYFPVITSIILSIILTLVLNLIRIRR